MKYPPIPSTRSMPPSCQDGRSGGLAPHHRRRTSPATCSVIKGQKCYPSDVIDPYSCHLTLLGRVSQAVVVTSVRPVLVDSRVTCELSGIGWKRRRVEREIEGRGDEQPVPGRTKLRVTSMSLRG